MATAVKGPQARYVTLGRLTRIKGQNILFSSSQRAIFVLNDTAADIWQLLDEGLSPATIGSRIACRGIDMHEANSHVAGGLENWERLGLIRPDLPPPTASTRKDVTQHIAIQSLNVRIIYPAALATRAAAVFRQLESDTGAFPDVLLELVEHGSRTHLFRNGAWLVSCLRDADSHGLEGSVVDRDT